MRGFAVFNVRVESLILHVPHKMLYGGPTHFLSTTKDSLILQCHIKRGDKVVQIIVIEGLCQLLKEKGAVPWEVRFDLLPIVGAILCLIPFVDLGIKKVEVVSRIYC